MEKTLVWIDSFLCNGQQSVVVNETKSQWAPVLSGVCLVCRGALFSVQLFSLYINDTMVVPDVKRRGLLEWVYLPVLPSVRRHN